MSLPSATPQNDWAPCRPGEISGYVAQVKRHRRLKKIQTAVGVATCALGFLFVGVVVYQNKFATPDFRPMNHYEVLALRQEYLDGSLDPETLARYEEHLSGCITCTKAVNDLRKELQGAAEDGRTQSLATLLARND